MRLEKPLKNECISLQTAEQKAFVENEKYRAEGNDTPSFEWNNLKRKEDEWSYPLPISFEWSDSSEEENNDAYYYLLISETEDIQNPLVYITPKCSYDVFNLKVGTEYFWCVQKNGKRSDVSSFKTLLTLPRFLYIEGISNVRDMGGYEVTEGRIRQGLIYRGGEFESHMHLGPLGAHELNRLAIRTEVDIRGEAIGKIDFTTAECFGIKRVFVPNLPYGKIFDSSQRSALKKFFKTFANNKNYPIYFHCWGGADRTGCLAFILGAFLGMKMKDLIYEYEVTSLAIWGLRSRNHPDFREFLNMFLALNGNTLHDKATVFLKDYAGLNDTQLDKIYNILVENE